MTSTLVWFVVSVTLTLLSSGCEAFLEAPNTIEVTVGSNVIHTVDSKFLSFTLDSGIFHGGLHSVNVNSGKFQALAKGMVHTYLRVGGTYADKLVFRDAHSGMSIISVHDFDSIYHFAKNAGWDMSFDLNLRLRKGSVWDSSNAKALLDYSVSKGYVFDLELGNEPDAYAHSVRPDQAGHDYVTLKHLMSTYPSFKGRRLIGPAITQGVWESFMGPFLQGASTVLNAITVHHYYGSGSSLTPTRMMDPSFLNSITGTINKAKSLISKYSKGTHTLWFAEVGLSWSRSGPDTTGFIAGFPWLDTIGMSAANGVSLLARQTFNGFADEHDNPTPEYWLTYIFKRTVGQKVLHLSSSEHNSHLRIYAHCSLTHHGGIAFYYLNLYRTDTKLDLHAYHGQTYEWYSLTNGGSEMSSSAVKLNGHTLTMNGNSFPAIHPVTSHTWPLVIPKTSYGILVLPSANHAACR